MACRVWPMPEPHQLWRQLLGHSSLETLRLVESTDPVSLGRLRPGLPKDLETICHKCLQKRPANRYQSVVDLRGDLQRFLAGQPVVARPISPAARALLWVRRNPSPSIAAAIVTASLATVILVGGWLLWRTQDALLRTTYAEGEQRRLAADLRTSVDVSNRSLYQSLIAQAAQALASNDVPAARRSLNEIQSKPELRDLARIEYGSLRRRAWPADREIVFEDESIVDFAWSPADDQLLALLDDGRIVTPGSQVVATSLGNSGPHREASQLALSANGRYAAVLAQDRVAIVELSPLHLVTTIETEEVMRDIQWHPTENTLLMVSRRSQLWASELDDELNDGVTKRMALFTGAVRQVTVTEDGQFVAALVGRDVKIARWPDRTDDFSTTAVGRVPDSQAKSPQSIGPFPDARFEEQWPLNMTWLNDNATLAVLDESGRVVAIQSSKTTAEAMSVYRRIWSIESGMRRPERLDLSSGQLLVIGNESIVAIGSMSSEEDGSFQPSILWQHPLPPNEVLRGFSEKKSRGDVPSIAYQEVGSQAVQLWNLNRVGTAHVIRRSAVPVRKVSLGDSGQLSAWRDLDGTITASNTSWTPATVLIRESTQPTTGLAVSPTDSLLATSRETVVTVYGMPAVTETFRVTGHRASVWSLAFDPSGRFLATGDNDGTLIVTNVADGSLVASVHVSDRDIRSIAFFPKSNRLAVADDNGRLFVCDVKSSSAEPVESVPLTDITSLSVLSEKKICAADSNGSIWCRDLTNEKREVIWSAHSGPIWSLQCVDDRILSASQDGKVRIWDSAGNLLLTLADLNQPVWSMQHEVVTNRLLGATTAGVVFKLDVGIRER